MSTAPPPPARRLWLRTVVGFVVVATVVQIGASGAFSYLAGRLGAATWLASNSEVAVRALDDLFADRMLRSLHVLTTSDAFAAAEAGGVPALNAWIDLEWNEQDDNEAWLATQHGALLGSDLPCAQALSRSLARLNANRGFVDCGDQPMLAVTTDRDAHVAVWGLHPLDQAYVDGARQISLNDVELVSGSIMHTTLHDTDDNRVGLGVHDPAHLPNRMAVVRVEFPRGYRGFTQAGVPIENWVERGNTQVSMFVYPRAIGDQSRGTLMFTAPVSIFILATRYSTIVLLLVGIMFTAGMAFVARRLVGRFTRPLKNLEAAASAIAKGELTARAPVDGDLEVQSLAQSFNKMVDQLTVSRMKLLQAEKLASVGQLASGIAHEMNTPMQFINDNTEFVDASMKKLLVLIERWRPVLERAAPEELRASSSEAKLAFLQEEVPNALAGSLEGIRRVSSIVATLTDLSNPGDAAKHATQIFQVIECAATESRDQWSGVADLQIDLPRDLPLVPLLRDDIEQVFKNVFVNAAQAIAATLGGAKQKGRIIVRAHVDAHALVVTVNDDGIGIPDSIKGRIFDPFFTTKDVGKGSGQGLAVAYAAVVQKHAGSLDVDSGRGAGTTFTIRLPLSAPVIDTRLAV